MGNWSRSRLALMCLFTATVLHTINMASSDGRRYQLFIENKHADRAVQATLILALLAYGTATFISVATLFARSSSAADQKSGSYSLQAILSLIGAIFTLVALSICQNRWLKHLKDRDSKVSDEGLTPAPYATALYVISMVLGVIAFILYLLKTIGGTVDSGNTIYIPASAQEAAPPGFQQPSAGPHRQGDGMTGLAAPAPEYIPRYGEA